MEDFLGLISAIPLGHQNQVLKGCLLCGLNTLSCCSRAAAFAAAHWWAGMAPGMASGLGAAVVACWRVGLASGMVVEPTCSGSWSLACWAPPDMAAEPGHINCRALMGGIITWPIVRPG